MSICLLVQVKKRKIDFKDGSMAAILDFLLEWFYPFMRYITTKFQVNWPLVQEKRKIYFQDGCHGGHLGFLIQKILAIFYLQVTLMLPFEFLVNWPFSSGEEVKAKFLRWPPWQQSWISGQILAIPIYNHLDVSYQVSCQLAFWFRRKEAKIDFLGVGWGWRGGGVCVCVFGGRGGGGGWGGGVVANFLYMA